MLVLMMMGKEDSRYYKSHLSPLCVYSSALLLLSLVKPDASFGCLLEKLGGPPLLLNNRAVVFSVQYAFSIDYSERVKRAQLSGNESGQSCTLTDDCTAATFGSLTIHSSIL